MARKRGADRDPWEIYLTELGRHGSVRKACLIAGVTRAELREKLRDDDEFSIAVADAEEDSIDRIEEAARTGAMCGDNQMQKYLLDNRRFKKQGDSTMVAPNINITIGSPKNEILQTE